MKECPTCRRCYPDETNHCPQDGDATTPSLLGEPTLDARYLLERRLGQGGMGVVFQARHIFLKTRHAIKVILPDLVGNDPMLTTRFRQEALAAAAIRHQNIIAVTDFGVVRGNMPFLVMEFIEGRSLQDILATEGAMSPQRAWEFISAIAAGVGAAHRQNIVHRDLKPLNIMVQDNVSVAEGVKILDFGLAKIKSGELLGSFVQAQTSGLMGSPFYMAPEQWSDEEPDARADIYSLGVILYQMLCRRSSFQRIFDSVDHEEAPHASAAEFSIDGYFSAAADRVGGAACTRERSLSAHRVDTGIPARPSCGSERRARCCYCAARDGRDGSQPDHGFGNSTSNQARSRSVSDFQLNLRSHRRQISALPSTRWPASAATKKKITQTERRARTKRARTARET